MGVPKFYRWTSERYPCLSQVVREHQIPEFDNLYLDMNGIIHTCSHPNDSDPHFRISEADIFKNIFHYIEVLFRIIKPQRNFFMAVDGVAPRAKMNQQRGRRFRTAKEAEDNIRRAIQKGEQLPDDDRFDSNCITPGTEFMARLHRHLQYFVSKKISTDPLWQNCNIYLSGHDVPGEGEHKVMDFIRHQKSQDGYDPNTRHCLYGLDADLIMLGLVTHEPHFSLLREEVRFGKQSKRVAKPEETVFHLLHLSLMREYLDFEFGELKETLPFGYDLERIIDDWVLLGFLVGNDFIPNLPNMHINHDALPTLYKAYIETMPTLDGYLHDGGILSLPRFQKYLDALVKFDRDRFEDVYADMKWMEGKTGRAVSSMKKKAEKKGGKFSKLVSQVEDDILIPVRNPFMALADLPNNNTMDDSRTELETKDDEQLEALFGELGVKDSDSGEDLFEMEFKQHKRAYYIEKFEVPNADEDFVATVAYEYILALQWTLHYYFNGVQSWSWFYPFHYSPYVSDLINIETFDLKLDKGTPFRPFEQLLAVLPAYSGQLLPEAFQNLMIMKTSPIIDYYPTKFKTDLNGKRQEWEAVVLIPFINEDRLLSAMQPHYSRLTDEEKERNSYGHCFKYQYSQDSTFRFASTFPGVFDDIEVCKARCTAIGIDDFRLDIKDIKKGLCENTLQDRYLPGFPTFNHIEHDTNLRKAGVRLFAYASRSNNMIVNIKQPAEEINAETVKETVGTVVHIEWPYLVEGLVTAVSDGERRFVYKQEERKVTEEKMAETKMKDVVFWMGNVRKRYLERKGIDSGEVNVLVEAKPLKGLRYKYGSNGQFTLEKEWADTHQFYPFQAIVQDLKVYESSEKSDVESLDKVFGVGSRCFLMSSPHYGCSGEVLEVDHRASRVRVTLSTPPEPDLSNVITNQTKLSDVYYSLEYTARKIAISTKLLLKVAGSVMVNCSKKPGVVDQSSRSNIGLKFKFTGQNREVLGYARREETGWFFSEKAIDVLCSYIQRFPNLFEKLSRSPEQELYEKSYLFPDKTREESLETVLDYLKALPHRQLEPVKCGCRFLDEKIVSAIVDAVDEVKKSKKELKYVTVRVKPHALFKATPQFGNLVPDPSVDYRLFDRVVNVRDNMAVPLGYRGTIIGVHEVKVDDKDENSPTEFHYEVVFDEEFLGGLKLRCESSRGAYMTSSSLLNLSFGSRKQRLKEGKVPSDITNLQEKAEPRVIPNITPYSSSKYGSESTPSRFKSYSRDNTPTGRPKDTKSGRYSSGGSIQKVGETRRFLDSSRVSDDDLKTPDYWLKPYGESRVKSTPKARRETPPRLSVRKSKAETAVEDDDGYEDMWNLFNDADSSRNDSPNISNTDSKSLDKEDEGKVDGSESAIPKIVDEEGTALLQKLLRIKLPQQQQQQQEKEQQQPRELHEAEHQQIISGDSLGEDLQSHTYGNSPIDKLLQGNVAAPPQPMFTTPASPPSPFFQGSPMPPTKSLQNWCFQNKMPSPTYTFSSTPQGVNAVVHVGPILRYGGLFCGTKEEAIESAALVALKHMAQMPFPRMPAHSQVGWPNIYMGHRPNIASPSYLYKDSSSQPWASPEQFVGGAHLRMEYTETTSETAQEGKKASHEQFYPQLIKQVQPIGSQMQPIGSQMQPIVSQMQPIVSQMQPIGSQMQPIGSQMQPIGSQIQPIGSQMQPIGSQMQPIGSQIQQMAHMGNLPGTNVQRPLYMEHNTVPPMVYHPFPQFFPTQLMRSPSQFIPASKNQSSFHANISVVSGGMHNVEEVDKTQSNVKDRDEVEKGVNKNQTTIPVFVPLQVNRASLSTVVKPNVQDIDTKTGNDVKPDDQMDLLDLNIAEGDDSNEPQGELSGTSLVTEGSSVITKDVASKDEESTEKKPKKEKPKRTFLLAPSFFAAKKE